MTNDLAYHCTNTDPTKIASEGFKGGEGGWTPKNSPLYY